MLKSIRRTGFLIAGICGLSACDYRDAASVKDDVLVYCSEGSPETFNPQLSTSGTTFDASSRTLYNRLVEFEPGSTLFKPALATRWQVSDDGKTYTFHLRRGVNFHSFGAYHPTRSFNAEDVLFSFNRQWLEAHPFHRVSNRSFRYFEAMGLRQLVTQVKAVDPFTVEFTLRKPDSAFLATMAMDFASILSAEYAAYLLEMGSPELIDSQPIGTGPFQLVRYQPDAYIRYKAHPDYWEGEQKLPHLVYAITPDASLRFARTFAGECDVMANPLPVQIDVAAQQDNMQVLAEPGLNIAFLTMNTEKAPFDDPRVRLAINYAVDKQAIINAVYQEKALVAVTPIPPNMWAFDANIEDFTFNPELARQLLDEAGVAPGFKLDIWTMSAQRAYNPNAKKMAELIQQDLKNIGIDVEISTFEYSTFLAKTRAGEHQSALMGWISDNGDPDNFFSPLLSCTSRKSGTNSARWCEESFDKIIEQARTTNQPNERQQLYSKAQQVFKQASPWVPLAHATQHAVINPRVKNFKLVPAGGVYFNQVYLENPSMENEETND